MIKKTLLRSIILLLFTLLLVNCSKNSDLSESTFLGRFDNTSWVSDSDVESYARFNSNMLDPLEIWLFTSLDCYIHQFFTSSIELEVIEDSRDTLILKHTEFDISLSFKAVGDTIKMSYSGGFTINYYKTTNTITDGLPICD